MEAIKATALNLIIISWGLIIMVLVLKVLRHKCGHDRYSNEVKQICCCTLYLLEDFKFAILMGYKILALSLYKSSYDAHYKTLFFVEMYMLVSDA